MCLCLMQPQSNYLFTADGTTRRSQKQCRPVTPASAIWMIPMTCLCSHSLMSQSLLQMIPMNEYLSQQSSVNPGCPGLLGSGPVTGQHARTIHTLTCLELMRRTLDWTTSSITEPSKASIALQQMVHSELHSEDVQ